MTAPSRPEAIASLLRSQILDGTYEAGARLPAEREMASNFGVNRGSVREALRKLEQLRLVEIRRGGGATVCRIEDASLDVVRHLLFLGGEVNRPVLAQILDVYEMVIVGAARLAAEHGSDAQIFHARDLVRRLGDPNTGPETHLDTVERLVDLIADASGNLVLRLCRNALDPFFGDRFRALRRRLRSGPTAVRQLAANLDAALATRDLDGVETAVRTLIRRNRAQFLDELERNGGVLHTEPEADAAGARAANDRAP